MFSEPVLTMQVTGHLGELGIQSNARYLNSGSVKVDLWRGSILSVPLCSLDETNICRILPIVNNQTVHENT